MKPDPPVAGANSDHGQGERTELPDELYEVFRRKRPRRPDGRRRRRMDRAQRAEAPAVAGRSGWRGPGAVEADAGAVDSGDPRSAENAAIDADLAREAAGQPGSPEGRPDGPRRGTRGFADQGIPFDRERESPMGMPCGLFQALLPSGSMTRGMSPPERSLRPSWIRELTSLPPVPRPESRRSLAAREGVPYRR